ncbi:MAG: flagellar hook-associated protein FlgK [Marinosulfonomonas sp.]|nr:flagellar hook-associated protein FlgK [Marinosulfonomonas sp.]
MGLSATLSNALSGLTAASRAAEIVSANVANAQTDGYGRRELVLTSATLGGSGGGVAVSGTFRSVDQHTIGERRLADAAVGQTGVEAAFYERLETIIGLPDDPASLSARTAQLQAVLLEAASRPDSDNRLNAILSTATGLSDHINSASDQVQNLRMDADQEIGRQVDTLNENLVKIADFNYQIRLQIGAGNDGSGLMDQRQQLIDSLAAIVPFQEVPRDNGQIALYTPGGAILLDGKPAEVSFTAVGVIVPQMTQASGALSGLQINGQSISTASAGPLSGGSLIELFAVRDVYATQAQSQLDGVARDLVERFENPAVDPTRSIGSPGLFTDAGGALNITNELGLAARLKINALVDPTDGGEIWRLRDGLGATAPGPVGNALIIQTMFDALGTPKIPASGGFSGVARSAVGLAGDLISQVNGDLRGAEANQSFAYAKHDALKAIELRSGVDTDQEMQQLLLVERAYSANARVISTVDDMIQTLLGI